MLSNAAERSRKEGLINVFWDLVMWKSLVTWWEVFKRRRQDKEYSVCRFRTEWEITEYTQLYEKHQKFSGEKYVGTWRKNSYLE